MALYEKDPISGEFYEVRDEQFTNDEWKIFCERFGQETKEKPLLNAFEVFLITFFLMSFVLMVLKAWGVLW